MYLILKFEDAGLFRCRINTKDKIYDYYRGKSRYRKITDEYVEPITVQQISNMLHVLFGERPKPKNRLTFHDRDEHIHKIAENSYLRIDSFKNRFGNYIEESVQTRKADWNATRPKGTYMDWQRAYVLMGKERYEEFVNIVGEVFGVTKDDIHFDDLCELIKCELIKDSTDDRINNLFERYQRGGLKSLYNYIYKGNVSEVNQIDRTKLSIINGFDKRISLDGYIIVPVTEYDLGRISQMPTLLDDGLVYIVSLNNDITIGVLEEFRRVGDISMEKRKLPLKKQKNENKD